MKKDFSFYKKFLLSIFTKEPFALGQMRVSSFISAIVLAFFIGTTVSAVLFVPEAVRLREVPSRQLIATVYNNSITIISPNGGEVWEKGSRQTVTWDSAGIPTDYNRLRIFLRYITPSGGEKRIDLTKNTLNDGSEEFVIPEDIPAGNYLLSIRAIELKGLPNLVEDTSDHAFQIIAVPNDDEDDEGDNPQPGDTNTITVLSPAGGEDIFKGGTFQVTWESKGIPHNNNLVDIFLQYEGDGPRHGKRVFIERKTVNDGIEDVIIPVTHHLIEGPYVLGVRAKVSTGNPSRPIGLSKIFTLKEGSGLLGGGEFVPKNPRFSCYDVRDGQTPVIHPHTGKETNHIDRRIMIELRQMDCFWRAFRWVEASLKDAPESLQPQIKEHLRLARLWQARAMLRYFFDSRRILESGKAGMHVLGNSEYAWIYIPNGFQELRKAMNLYPQGIQNNFNQAMMELIGARLENGQINISSNPYNPTPKAKDYKMPKGFEFIGAIRGNMTFNPLTSHQIRLLEQLQRLHTAATTAIVDRRHEDRVQIAREYDAITEALIASARNVNEQILFTLPPFTRVVCFDRPDPELRELVARVDHIHHQWVEAIKNTRLAGTNGAWQLGLMHARGHVILSTCSIGEENVPDFTWEREFPSSSFK
jgi:hypothetical protein